MSDILDDNEDYQEDIEQVEDNEVIDDEQDIDDSQDGEQDDDTEQEDSADDDVLNFSFDDDGDSDEKDPWAGQKAPPWVKDTRNENRELKRQLRELQKQQGQHEQQQALREKPTLDAHEYDSEAYEEDVQQWFVEKRQYDAQVQAEQQKYQQYHERYKADVDAVSAKAPDYNDAETVVVETLSVNKQHLLQMLVEKPAAVVYALGKNSPAQLENLSKLDDIQFARQIVLMEQQMSSNSKSRNPNKPKPKTHELEGAAGGTDAKLAKLEAEADRTNDRTALIAYRKKMKNK